MHMTTKGRLAVVAMIDLGLQSQAVPTSLTSIAQRRNISQSYLEQLFGKLRRSGIVRSVRGPGGGYVLAQPAAAITLADIVLAVDSAPPDDSFDDAAAFEREPGRCDTGKLWRDLHARMIELLGVISLGSLVAEELARPRPVEPPSIRRGISSEPVVKRVRTTAPNSVFSLAASLPDTRPSMKSHRPPHDGRRAASGSGHGG